jgi:hypothetical protein
VGSDHHGARGAVESLREGYRRQTELGQLGHVRVVVDELGAALAQEREDLQGR